MEPLFGSAIISGITDIGGKLIDRIFPDKIGQETERAKAVLALESLRQDGSIKELQVQMSAILAEAQSADPWTSRSRPSFLYVMYIMILVSIPMGVLSAFKPDIAIHIADGMKAWLAAIPSDLWAVFGVGYLGYTGARSFEKNKKLIK